MEADQYQKIKEIFQSVLEAPTDQRQELLNERCAADSDVRAEVERLLESYESGFLENPAVGELAAGFTGNGFESGGTIGHYTIIRKIGSGGMGEVYLAEDGKLGRQVAIKLLPETFTEDEDRLRRFEQEARTASALNHPNILTIHEIGETGNTRYIATEYIDGETLRARLNRGRLSVTEALEIAIQCASALAAAHENGIIHRDIKPENIMLRRDNLVKLLDFGLAKLAVAPSSTGGPEISYDAPTERHLRTAPGVIMGTVQYMSPEQTRGHATDARTDIWSLGVVIYEMIAGTPPFAGESTADLIAEIVKTFPTPLSDRSFNVPERLSELVARTLEKDRENRHQSSKLLVLDLKAARTNLNFSAKPLDSGERTLTQARFETDHRFQKAGRRSVVISGKHFVLIGRRYEIQQIGELIRDQRARLVTLTGVGGTGKTTVAKVIADEVRNWFEGDVHFVELASVTNPDNLLSAVAQAIHLQEVDSRPIAEILKDHLRENPTLLILDNFEQIASAATILKQLLDNAPTLRVLVTSRVLLDLTFETEVPISTLDVPDLAGQPSSEELSNNDSVRLFVERAIAADRSFSLSEDNAFAIAAICRNLDGIPLAIELAAARVRILSPEAIVKRLENKLFLLTGGGKDLPVRQQSVRAAVGWSYELLSEEEQALFRRLAVFSGGFTVNAAEEVVGQFNSGTLDAITTLFNASLIVRMTSSANEPRFRMLEVVREFALEFFEASSEANEIRLRHALFFLEIAEEAEEHLRISRSAEWSDRLEIEYQNLRLALAWSFGNRVDLAARLSAAIPMFWIQRGYLTEGKCWLDKAVALDGLQFAPSVRFRHLMGLGVISKFQGDLEGAEAMFSEALAIGIHADDHEQLAWSKRQLGSVASLKGDLEKSQRYLEESLAINRKSGNQSYTAYTLAELGSLFHARGNLELAGRNLEESLKILRRTGHKAWVGLICWELGTISYRKEDFTSASSYYSESLSVAHELDFKSSISNNLDGFAALSAKCGDFERSALLAAAAEKLRISIGFEMMGGDRIFLNSYIAELRSALPEDEFEAFWVEGRKLSLSDAVDLALGVGRPE